MYSRQSTAFSLLHFVILVVGPKNILSYNAFGKAS